MHINHNHATDTSIQRLIDYLTWRTIVSISLQYRGSQGSTPIINEVQYGRFDVPYSCFLPLFLPSTVSKRDKCPVFEALYVNKLKWQCRCLFSEVSLQNNAILLS